MVHACAVGSVVLFVADVAGSTPLFRHHGRVLSLRLRAI
jgi:hypothetical protein